MVRQRNRRSGSADRGWRIYSRSSAHPVCFREPIFGIRGSVPLADADSHRRTRSELFRGATRTEWPGKEVFHLRFCRSANQCCAEPILHSKVRRDCGGVYDRAQPRCCRAHELPFQQGSAPDTSGRCICNIRARDLCYDGLSRNHANGIFGSCLVTCRRGCPGIFWLLRCRCQPVESNQPRGRCALTWETEFTVSAFLRRAETFIRFHTKKRSLARLRISKSAHPETHPAGVGT